jgi:hypothetical protein
MKIKTFFATFVIFLSWLGVGCKYTTISNADIPQWGLFTPSEKVKSVILSRRPSGTEDVFPIFYVWFNYELSSYAMIVDDIASFYPPRGQVSVKSIADVQQYLGACFIRHQYPSFGIVGADSSRRDGKLTRDLINNELESLRKYFQDNFNLHVVVQE